MSLHQPRWPLPLDRDGAWKRFYLRRSLVALALPLTALLTGLAIRHPLAVAVPLLLVLVLIMSRRVDIDRLLSTAGDVRPTGSLSSRLAAGIFGSFIGLKKVLAPFDGRLTAARFRKREMEELHSHLDQMAEIGAMTSAQVEALQTETRRLSTILLELSHSATRLPPPVSEAPVDVLLQLAAILAEAGQPEEARSIVQFLTRRAVAEEEQGGVATLGDEKGVVLSYLRRHKEAWDTLMEAYRGEPLVQDPVIEAAASFQLGFEAESRAQSPEGQDWLIQAAKGGESAGLHDVAVQSLFRLSKIALDEGRLSDAVSDLRKCLTHTTSEQHRQRADSRRISLNM